MSKWLNPNLCLKNRAKWFRMLCSSAKLISWWLCGPISHICDLIWHNLDPFGLQRSLSVTFNGHHVVLAPNIVFNDEIFWLNNNTRHIVWKCTGLYLLSINNTAWCFVTHSFPFNTWMTAKLDRVVSVGTPHTEQCKSNGSHSYWINSFSTFDILVIIYLLNHNISK